MKSDGPIECESKGLSNVTIQPLWKRGVDGIVYAHAELRLRGAWLLDIFKSELAHLDGADADICFVTVR
jgi:hypothetical protein